MYVELVLTVATVLGMLLYYWHDIVKIVVRIKDELTERVENKRPGDAEAYNNLYYMPEGVNQAIKRLITVSFGVNNSKAVYLFWILTLGIPAVLACATWRILPSIVVFFITVVSAVLPMTIMLGVLQNMRVRSSREGKLLVSELLDNYKINYYNMQNAIEITGKTIEEAPTSRRLLFNLSKGINRAASNGEIKSLLNDFKYAIGTSWAVILSDNMYFALASGIRVEHALEDLIRTISMAEELAEKVKRENNEAGLILKYLAPGCYLCSVLAGIKIFGLTSKEFLYYQFQTTAGIMWFSVVVVTYIISLICQFFMTRNKLDL